MSPEEEQEKKEVFVKAYEALCKERGFQIAYAPQWRQSMDTGTYSLVIVPVVVEFKFQP